MLPLHINLWESCQSGIFQAGCTYVNNWKQAICGCKLIIWVDNQENIKLYEIICTQLPTEIWSVSVSPSRGKKLWVNIAVLHVSLSSCLSHPPTEFWEEIKRKLYFCKGKFYDSFLHHSSGYRTLPLNLI